MTEQSLWMILILCSYIFQEVLLLMIETAVMMKYNK